jgi:RNA polymerase sigma-54 factor
MKLSLDLRTSLSQTLTPQQIQYLKLLQLPVLQLEQQVLQELEQNPMLEEANAEDAFTLDEQHEDYTQEERDYAEATPPDSDFDADYGYDSVHHEKTRIDDQGDPFEFYKLVWQDDSSLTPKNKQAQNDDEGFEYFQMRDIVTLIDEMTQQIRMIDFTNEEIVLGEQIVGNVDTDGYLRRDLAEIVQETNEIIEDHNFELQMKAAQELRTDTVNSELENPARQFDVTDSAVLLAKVENNLRKNEHEPAVNGRNGHIKNILNYVTQEQAEKVLKRIQLLDPPGFASRNIQECLIAQIKALPKLNAAQKLALEILELTYESFAMKHYPVIMKQLGVSEDYLREAIDVIRRLNPKPGYAESHTELNTVIPDFVIFRDEETNELMINVNDSRLPVIRLNQAYEKLKKDAKNKLFNKETKEWIRSKYEDAKFLIQAIRQRKTTMLKVMTSIAELQKDYFYNGPTALKPLIYKDISEETGLDISTVCRIVNGKYVQSEFGTQELKFFFSESLPSDDGDEVSTTVIKQIIKEIIDSEPKNKPFSDDKIGKDLQKRGYQIARRTVAKYREQLRIPVARLRREL